MTQPSAGSKPETVGLAIAFSPGTIGERFADSKFQNYTIQNYTKGEPL